MEVGFSVGIVKEHLQPNAWRIVYNTFGLQNLFPIFQLELGHPKKDSLALGGINLLEVTLEPSPSRECIAEFTICDKEFGIVKMGNKTMKGHDTIAGLFNDSIANSSTKKVDYYNGSSSNKQSTFL